MAMKQGLENIHWTLTEGQTPARSYFEARQTEIERGEIRAEQLTSVYAADQD